MSRKPTTPPSTSSTDSENTDTDARDPLTRPAGRRFTGDKSILDTERELVADGVELDNRAIPVKDHAECGDDIDEAEIRARVNEEADKENPNRNRIAYLNQRLEGEA